MLPRLFRTSYGSFHDVSPSRAGAIRAIFYRTFSLCHIKNSLGKLSCQSALIRWVRHGSSRNHVSFYMASPASKPSHTSLKASRTARGRLPRKRPSQAPNLRIWPACHAANEPWSRFPGGTAAKFHCGPDSHRAPEAFANRPALKITI